MGKDSDLGSCILDRMRGKEMSVGQTKEEKDKPKSVAVTEAIDYEIMD